MPHTLMHATRRRASGALLAASAALTLFMQPLTADYAAASTAPLTITTQQALPQTTGLEPYALTLTASGGTTPYVWSLGAGALPSGLTLAANGQISGTAPGTTTVQVAHFTAQVKDAAGHAVQQDMSLTVVPNKYFGISGNTAGLWLGGTLNVAQSCLCYLTVDATVGAPNWAKVGPHNFTFMKYDDTGKLNFVFRFLESNCNCAAAIGPLPTDSAALHYTGWVDPSTSKELQLHPEHFQVVFNSVGAYPDGLAHPDGLPIGSLQLISVGPGVTG